MKKNKEIFCTLGPSTINKKFLKFSNKKISLLRLNMSHVKINELEKTIKFVRKFSKRLLINAKPLKIEFFFQINSSKKCQIF